MGQPNIQAQQMLYKAYSEKNALEELPVKAKQVSHQPCKEKRCECEELIGNIELTAGDRFYFNMVRPYVSQEIFWTCVFVGAVVVGLTILKRFGIKLSINYERTRNNKT